MLLVDTLSFALIAHYTSSSRTGLCRLISSPPQNSFHLCWQVNAINELIGAEAGEAPGPARTRTENNSHHCFSERTAECKHCVEVVRRHYGKCREVAGY